MICGNSIFSQEITGKIKTELDKPVSDAIVRALDSTYVICGFSITDVDGAFSINYPQSKLPFYLVVNHISFQSDTIKLGKERENISLELLPSEYQLPEVKVEAERRKYNNAGDTTRYDAASFQDGHEKNLEEVLAKLPGVKVDPDGSIYLRGKRVANVLIEQDDLFGKRYAIGTKSMNPVYVEEFEFIDKYEKEELMRGISASDELILNLKLNDEFKVALFGDATAGIGIPERYLVRGNLFSINKNNKSVVIVNSNNVNYESFDLLNYMDGSGNAFDDLAYNRSINRLVGNGYYQRQGLPFELQARSNNNTLNLNNISRVGKLKSDTKIGLSLLENRFRERSENNFLGQNQSFTQFLNDTLEQTGGVIFNEMSFAPSDESKFYLRTEISYQNQGFQSFQEISSFRPTTESTKFSTVSNNLKHAHNLEYLHKISDSQLIKANYTYLNNKIDEQAANLPQDNILSFSGLVPFNEHLNQTAYDHSFAVNWLRAGKKLKSNVSAGVNHVSDSAEARVNLNVADTLAATFRRTYTEPFFGASVEYAINPKSRLNFSGRLTTADIDSGQEIFYRININHQHAFNTRLKALVASSYYKRPIAASQVSNLSYYSDFSSLIIRNSPINSYEGGTLLGSLIWSVPKRQIELQWTAYVNLRKIPIQNIEQVSVASQQEYTESFYQPSINSSVSLDKYFPSIKANLNFTANYYETKSNDSFNGFSNFSTQKVDAGLILSTNDISFFRFVFGSKILLDRVTVDNNSRDIKQVTQNDFLETRFQFTMNPLKSKQLKIDIKSYSYSSLSESFNLGKNQFLEVSSSFNFNDQHNLSLVAKNIFNRRNFNNVIVNTFNIQTIDVSLQSTFIYLSYFFRFSN